MTVSLLSTSGKYFVVTRSRVYTLRLNFRKKSRKEGGPQTVADMNMVRPTDSKPIFKSYLVARDNSSQQEYDLGWN